MQPTQLSSGTVANVADYEVIRLLSEGNHGRFYLARPPARLGIPDEFVALKLFLGVATELTKKMWGNIPVIPVMSTGATDGAYLRAKGIAVYGVPLFRKDGELRMHGNDERVPVDSLEEGTDYIYRTLMEVAAKK